MLLSTILTFLNVYFNNLLLINLLLETVFFLILFFFAGTQWYIFLAQIPVGVVLGLLGRYMQRRKEVFAISARALYHNWIVYLLITLLLCLPGLLYSRKIYDPASSLVEPFSIGIMLFLVLFWLGVFIIECVGYWFSQLWCEFKIFGMFPLSAIVVTLVAFLDLLAFRQSFVTFGVLVVLAAVVLIGGWLFKLLMTPRTP